MNKKQFLKRLKHELRGLPREEIEASLRFYDEAISEHMEHGKPETEAVEAVGYPEDAAGRILSELPDEVTDRMIRNRSLWRKIALPALIIGLPVWIALIIAAVAVVISLAATYLAVTVSVFAAAAALFAAVIPGVYLVMISGTIGNALMCSDCAITLMACVAFGMETGLFCITGLIIKCVMVDMVLENIKTHKCFHIITSNPEPVADFIINELHRGATELHGEGAYTHKDKTVLMTVVNRREAVMLRRYVKSIDPTAFLLITNTGDIIGKGFRGTN